MTSNRIKKIALSAAGGFTLIETLVAVLLLSTAIAGPLTIASKGLSSSLTAKDQIGAFYLAQDAIEYVRFKRDSNKLAGQSWLTGVVGSGLCSADGTQPCVIDSIQDTVVATSSCATFEPNSANAACILNYDTTNHFYTYAALGSHVVRTPERYIRSISIITPVGTNPDEASITATVVWTGQGGVRHSVIVRENLYDW